METLKAIHTRRSIREYTDEQIPEGIVTKLLDAAMAAPNAMDKQPWHFLILNQKDEFAKILKINQHAEMLKQTKLGILVCGDKNLEENVDFIVQDCSAATQNILLAAHDLGLGAVWVSVYPMAEVINGLRNLFNIPENIVPITLISLGYPNEKIEQPVRFKEERVHRNVW